jgi:hypothetical protein
MRLPRLWFVLLALSFASSSLPLHAQSEATRSNGERFASKGATEEEVVGGYVCGTTLLTSFGDRLLVFVGKNHSTKLREAQLPVRLRTQSRSAFNVEIN